MYTLYKSLKKILKSKSDYKEIGIRYGEKMHETLVSEEEMLKTKDDKNFYIFKNDKKNENFENYFFKGKRVKNLFRTYNSSNTKRLDEKELTKILSKLFF